MTQLTILYILRAAVLASGFPAIKCLGPCHSGNEKWKKQPRIQCDSSASKELKIQKKLLPPRSCDFNVTVKHFTGRSCCVWAQVMVAATWSIIHTLSVMQIMIQFELKSSQNSNLFENSPRAQTRGWISTWLSPRGADQQAPPTGSCNPNSGQISTQRSPVGAPPPTPDRAVNIPASRCAWVLPGTPYFSDIFLGNFWITTKGSAFCSKGSWALIFLNLCLLTLLLTIGKKYKQAKKAMALCVNHGSCVFSKHTDPSLTHCLAASPNLGECHWQDIGGIVE